MTTEMKIYSAGNTKWSLTEEGLESVVQQFSHPGRKRRHYMALDYQGGKVFIKSFLEKGLTGHIRHLVSPRGKTEFQIGSRLAFLGISTPRVLGYGTGRNTSAVVEEHIDGPSLLYAIQKTPNRDNLLILLADFLKQLKLKRVRHNDLHLDNILMHGDKLYLIDLHKTKIKNRFNDADEMSNITHALGMIYDDISDKERDLFFAQYGRDDKIRRKIEDHIRRLKINWVINKKKRAFRNTSVLRVSDGYVYLKGAESEASGEFVTHIKKDKKVTVELYSDHIRKVYRHQRRLKTAWENHVVLTYLGSNAVPRPYYMKLPLLSSDGYIAMEDMGHKGIEFDRFLDGKYDGMTFIERKILIDSFTSFFQSLFRQRIVHKDMKGCNIFVLNDSHFILLDVEDITFEEIREERLKRILVQLNTTIPKRISIKDRMRFFLKLTSSRKINKKRLFKDIAKTSLESDIVYEGIGGLKTEQW
jgi:tRNA A-37 threonylcarbamoyl transferase component Bud32